MSLWNKIKTRIKAFKTWLVGVVIISIFDASCIYFGIIEGKEKSDSTKRGLIWGVVINSIILLLFAIYAIISCFNCFKSCISPRHEAVPIELERVDEVSNENNNQSQTSTNQQTQLIPCIDRNGNHLIFQGFHMYTRMNLREYYVWNNSQYIPIIWTRDQYGNGNWQYYNYQQPYFQ